MTYEIEKKFLVKQLPGPLDRYQKKQIQQYYIAGHPTIRLRQWGDAYFLTVKGQGALIRKEYEIPVAKALFIQLYPYRESKTIQKERYFIPLDGGLTAELDVYHDALEGLMTVEVEFSNVYEAKKFKAPVWFGKDVTKDRRYSNYALSYDGIPPAIK